MNAKRHFFVLGLPRSRTAWLSVLLSQSPAFCYHEATLGGGFDGMKSRMERAEAAVTGNADSALLFHAERLRAEFPEAKILFVHRDADAALASEVAAFPEQAEQWREKWPAVLMARDAALRVLEDADVRHVEFERLEHFYECAAAVRHCTGGALAEWRFEHLSGLRVEQAEAARVRSALSPAVVMPPVELAAGLHVRMVTAGDLEMVSGWSDAHGCGELPLAVLPPLGVMVEDEKGPAGALWCYESFGTGVAWLEFAVTRPGLSPQRAREVMRAAVQACMVLAGKGCEPKGTYRIFRVSVRPAMVRFLERLGFRTWGEMKQPMLLEL